LEVSSKHCEADTRTELKARIEKAGRGRQREGARTRDSSSKVFEKKSLSRGKIRGRDATASPYAKKYGWAKGGTGKNLNLWSIMTWTDQSGGTYLEGVGGRG